MRRSPAALRFSTRLSAPTLLTLIASIAIFSTFSFAAAPDRIASTIVPDQFVKLQAGVPLKAQPKFDQGRVERSTRLNYVTLLTVPTKDQQRALRKLLADQQNPKSKSYHKWITPEQYADQFGLSPIDVSKINSWLKSQGFVVQNVARGRNWVTFSGSAEQVESALHTELHNYKTSDAIHFSNSTIPSVPTALAGIVSGFRGLNDFRMQPTSSERTQNRLHRDYYDSSFRTNFVAPGDAATIYDLAPLYTAGIDGTGQKLAVAGQTDIYLADITNFRSGFSLPAISGCTVDGNGILTACNSTNLRYVLLGTDPGAPSPGDLGETDLDLEWSGAVAKNAQIIYVNGETSNGVGDAFYYAIDQNLAPVISLSYGICELGEALNGDFAADEAELQKANSLGITFLNSSGDVGAAGCDGFTNPDTNPPNLAIYGLQVSYPASSPEVTGVGGTALPFSDLAGAPFWTTTNSSNGNSALSYIPEQAWNDTFEFAAFCAANSSNSFCTGNGITDGASAQAALGIGAGGGGASNCASVDNSGACLGGFAQPSWQTVTVPNTSASRFVPDVSLLASPNFPGYIFCTQQSELGLSGTGSSCAPGGSAGIVNALALTNTHGNPVPSIIGGTSVATPVFAGVVALMNHYLVQNSFQASPGLGNANPSLYQMAIYNQSAFHPVTTGSNLIYCETGTLAGQPTPLICPAPVAPATVGVIGYQASNADSVTGYNLVTGLGSIDGANLATAWGQLLTPSTTSLAISSANIIQGQNETFTITVTPASASGVVNLAVSNGGTSSLATPTITAGTGTFSTSSLAVGTNSITGQYTGTNAASTSAAVVVNVTAPTFTWAATGCTTNTVLSGQSTTCTFHAAPTGISTFADEVTFLCETGLPNATTCTFNTGQAISSVIAAGSGATDVSLTIATSGPNPNPCSNCVRPKRASDKHIPLLPVTLPLAGLVMVGLVGRKLSRHSAAVGLCVSLALLGLLIACGGGGSNPVSVSVSAGAPSSIYPNNPGSWPAQTAQFTATVANATNTAVNWTVSGGSANGTIDANGIYTSPTIVAGLPSSVTIIATSQADSTKSGQATETLTPATVPGTYTIAVQATEASTKHSVNVSLTAQ